MIAGGSLVLIVMVCAPIILLMRYRARSRGASDRTATLTPTFVTLMFVYIGLLVAGKAYESTHFWGGPSWWKLSFFPLYSLTVTGLVLGIRKLLERAGFKWKKDVN